MTTSSIARDATVAAVPAIVVVTLLLGVGLTEGPTFDGAVYALIGDGLLHGLMPYLDLFDQKPPGVYLVNAGTGVAVPFLDPWARAWLASWVSTILALWLVSFGVRRAGYRRGVIAVALLGSAALFGARHFALGGGQTESVALAPAVLAVVLVLGSTSTKAVVMAGLSAAVAVLISFQCIPVAIAVVAWLLIRRATRRAVGAVVLAGASLPVLVVAWLAVAGALPDAVEQVVSYSRLYVANNQQYRLGGLRTMTFVVLFVLPIFALGAARLITARRQPLAPLETVAALWLAGWIVTATIQGLIFEHYVIAVAPAVAILAASMLDRLAAVSELPGQRRGLALIMSLTVAFPFVGIALTQGVGGRPPSMDPAVAEIEARTGPSDPIFVWGNEPSIYLATESWPAGRYSYLAPLTVPGFGSAATSEELIETWEDPGGSPALIIDASVNPGRVGWYSLTEAAPDGVDDALDPLRAWIAARYELVAVAGTWQILAPVVAAR